MCSLRGVGSLQIANHLRDQNTRKRQLFNLIKCCAPDGSRWKPCNYRSFLFNRRLRGWASAESTWTPLEVLVKEVIDTLALAPTAASPVATPNPQPAPQHPPPTRLHANTTSIPVCTGPRLTTRKRKEKALYSTHGYYC
jgi:hypothetical protein